MSASGRVATARFTCLVMSELLPISQSLRMIEERRVLHFDVLRLPWANISSGHQRGVDTAFNVPQAEGLVFMDIREESEVVEIFRLGKFELKAD